MLWRASLGFLEKVVVELKVLQLDSDCRAVGST